MTGLRVLVTGDRNWSDARGLSDTLDAIDLSIDYLMSGGCRGADTAAAAWAEAKGIEHLEFLANWDRDGRSAGPRRNRVMLDRKPDVVLAFHDHLETSKGTGDCVTEARWRGIPVWHIFHPVRP